jgi:tetratricopeptide (TPR) repeat protein
MLALVVAFQPSLVRAQGMEVTSAKVYLKENPPNLEKARDLLETALTKDPKHNEAHFFLGMVHYYKGNFDAFFEHWNQVAYDKLGKAEKQQFTRQLGDVVRLRMNDATRQYNEKKFPEAAKQFKASITAANMLQTALKASGKKEDMESANKLEPNKQQAYLFLGYAALSSDNLDEAVPALEKVVEADPKSVQAWDGLVNAYARQKNTDKLIAACTKSIELAEQPDLNTYLLLRNTYLEKGDTARVYETYERALTAFPTEMSLYRDLSGLYAQNRMYEKAAAVLEKGTTAMPDNIELLGYLGTVYYNIGYVKQEGGDKTAAQAAFNKALPPLEKLLALEPKSIDGHDTLGKVYYGLAKTETDSSRQQALNTKGDALIEKRRELIRTGEGK